MLEAEARARAGDSGTGELRKSRRKNFLRTWDSSGSAKRSNSKANGENRVLRVN